MTTKVQPFELSREEIDQFAEVLHAQAILAKKTFVKKIKPLMATVFSGKKDIAEVTLRYGGAPITSPIGTGSVMIDYIAKLAEKKYGKFANTKGQVIVKCIGCKQPNKVGHVVTIYGGTDDNYVMIFNTEPNGFNTRVRFFKYETHQKEKPYIGPMKGAPGFFFVHNVGELYYLDPEDNKLFE